MTTAAVFSQASGGVLIASPVNRTAHRWVPRNRNGSRSGHDNLRLKPREYVISLRGVEVARWETHNDNLLAISSEVSPPPLAGTATREPAFGVSAVWISPSLQNQALATGYAVVDQSSVVATHLAEVIKQHAYELLTRQETKRLLDRLAESHPKLVEELLPKVLSLGEAQKVLQQLLREQVSIRDLSTIMKPRWTPHPRPGIRFSWSRRRAKLWAGLWSGRFWPRMAGCVWSLWITASKKNSVAPSLRKCPPQ